MPAEVHPGDNTSSVNAAELFEPLQAVLADAPEPERYRLLGAFLSGFAGRAAAQQDGRDWEASAAAEQARERLAALSSENARLKDAVAKAEDDLAVAERQLELEKHRSEELQRAEHKHRSRVRELEGQVAELEGQITHKNAQLREAERRAEKIETEQRTPPARLSEYETGGERPPTAGPTAGADETVLDALWTRLRQANPPLVNADVRPTQQDAERLVDAFVELARFVHRFDQETRPILAEFTQYDRQVFRLWGTFGRLPELIEQIRRVIDVRRREPAGVLRGPLRLLHCWTQAALIGSHSATESIARELGTHMRGPLGTRGDPNRKIKDYLQADGPELFLQRIRELCSENLEKCYENARD